MRRVALVVVLIVAPLSCKLFSDRKAAACTSFEGGNLTATWTGCPDKVRREIKCATFIDDLKCDCYEDGAQKTFFHAKDPPLSNRTDATRVANANCRWSLESP
jgi:hypothetical protein